MDTAALTSHWLAATRQLVPDLQLFDAHTHIGQNDPDGFKQTPEQLLARLQAADARGCFVFPMHEPGGYRPANDMVIEAAQRSGGLLVPFCRVAPGQGALAEAQRALARGAMGIKLHPRAERFTLDHPELRDLFALAHERSLPILIHAGRGIPALGAHVIALADEFNDARVILAHAGVSDLSWIWRAAAHLPNLLFDSSWSLLADLAALFRLVPPGQILFASDAPYGRTAVSAIMQTRLALQAGWNPDQVRLFAAGQGLRIAAGQPLGVTGPALGEAERAERVLLERLTALLQMGVYALARGGNSEEVLSLAALACEVPAEIDDAPVFRAVQTLLGVAAELGAPTPTDRSPLVPLLLALAVSATPDVPLPLVELPDQA